MMLNGHKSGDVYPYPCEDTPIEWYDFGGGRTVAPNIPLDVTTIEGPRIAALCCVRGGKFYYYIIGGEFQTEADLTQLRPEVEAEFTRRWPELAHA